MKNFDIMNAIKAMTNPIRFEIVKYLYKGPSCATKALDGIKLSQPNLSQHLNKLKDAGIVDCKTRGSERCYFICRPTFVKDMLKIVSKEHKYQECTKPEQE
jgi:ArsR family transcriptional regulator